MTTTDTLLSEGITYRQLDHWCKAGYLHVSSKGSGTPRDWPHREVKVARFMARLVTAGLTPKAAAEVARQVAASDEPIAVIEIGAGITVGVRT
jgi:MerR-like DNA binding protein